MKMGIWNKKIKDSDADGILDTEEKKIGTDPNNPDTDHDGLGDYQEVNIYGTDPLNPDSDGDGMNDGDEVKQGRNPLGLGLLKDLFIPSAANNYQPRALAPKRLLFYSISAIIIKIVIVVFIISLPLTAWLTPDVMSEQAQKIITLTNSIRSNLGLANLVENNLLDISAYNKAQDMLVNQYFSHTSSDGKRIGAWLNSVHYDYSVAGENLAMGFSSAENVVNAWTKSKTHYSNMIDPDFNEIGVGVVAGNYLGKETTLVAQHFGTLKSNPHLKEKKEETKKIKIVTTGAIENNNQKIKNIDSNVQVLEKTENTNSVSSYHKNDKKSDNDLEEQKENKSTDVLSIKEAADSSDPESKSEGEVNLIIDHPQAKNETIVRAEAHLDKNVVTAEIDFNDQKIQLNQNDENKNIWTGSAVISKNKEKDILNPVIPASIKTVDKNGNTDLFDANWVNIKPLETTILNQYLFLKTYTPQYVQKLFSFSAIYYQLLLVLVCLAFLLNIFIKIKKQNFKIILSTVSFITLLVFLIIV